MTKKQTYVAISFGWDSMYAVPTEKVSTLLALLDDCHKVKDKNIKDAYGDYQRCWYKTQKARRISIEQIDELFDAEPVEVVCELQSA